MRVEAGGTTTTMAVATGWHVTTIAATQSAQTATTKGATSTWGGCRPAETPWVRAESTT